MNCTIDEDQYGWVIKDQDNHFAHRSSVKGTSTRQYISYIKFSQKCRWYENKESAEIALAELNKKRRSEYSYLIFHIEHVDLEKIMQEYDEFVGDNMIVKEKVIGQDILSEAI